MPDLKMSNHHSTIPPCKDCSDREIGCHSYCKAYGEWAKEHSSKREDMFHQRTADMIANDYSLRCIEKRKKGIRKWRRRNGRK